MQNHIPLIYQKLWMNLGQPSLECITCQLPQTLVQLLLETEYRIKWTLDFSSCALETLKKGGRNFQRLNIFFFDSPGGNNLLIFMTVSKLAQSIIN